MKFPERLKQLRMRQGLTQEQVAELLTISTQTVSKWERGLVQPDIQMLPRIAVLYKTSADIILGMADPMESKQAKNYYEMLETVYLPKRDKESTWKYLRDEILLHPDDYSLYLQLMMLTYREEIRTPEKIEQLVMLTCWLERTCTNTSIRNAAYRYMTQICSECPDEKLQTKAKEYYWKIPSLRDSREVYSYYVLKGEELNRAHRETLFFGLNMVETAFRMLLPKDATIEQQIDWHKRSIALYHIMYGDDYAGVYEIPVLFAFRNLLRVCLVAGRVQDADEAYNKMVAVMERQIQYHINPKEVPFSVTANHEKDARYPNPEISTMDMMQEMLRDEVFAPYHERLRAFDKRYREVFITA